MHPRTTTRWRGNSAAAAVATLAGLLLGGCGDPEPSGGPVGAPSASPPSTSSPATTPPTTVPSAEGAWGAYPGRSQACAAIAEDLLALALLPASLSGGPTPDQVQGVEDEVEGVRAAVPPELDADFARVQLLVDSYGEELAQDPGARFDGQSLDAALAPVRDWLDETCREAG